MYDDSPYDRADRRRTVDLREPQRLPVSWVEPAVPPGVMLRRLADRPAQPGGADELATAFVRFASTFRSGSIDALSADDLEAAIRSLDPASWRRMANRLRESPDAFPKVRNELLALVDEDRPIMDRLQRLWPVSGSSPLPVSRTMATMVLNLAHPTRYGIWSTTAEQAMRRLGTWPTVPAGKARAYPSVNKVLLELARESDLDLRALESLWPDVALLSWSSLGYGYPRHHWRGTGPACLTVRLHDAPDARGFLIPTEMLAAAGIDSTDDLEMIRTGEGVVVAAITNEYREAMLAYQSARAEYLRVFSDEGRCAVAGRSRE